MGDKYRFPSEEKKTNGSLKDIGVNRSVCDGFKCLEYASSTIQVSTDTDNIGNISLHLCDNCVKIFKQEELHSNKKVVEQQVVEPVCSNTSSQNQPIQQRGVLLDG
jgi:hypothetical protein